MGGEWMRHALSAALAVAIALVGTARAGGAERITTGLAAGTSAPQSPYVVSRYESDSLTGAGRPDQNMVSAPDPHDPVRIVVELAHQPLIPYLQQARAEHLAAAKSGTRVSAAERSSRLARAIGSQRHVLEQAQAQLLGDMRREGWIKAEHWRFTGLLDAVSITTRYEHLAAIAKDPRVAAVHMDTKVQALLDTSVGVVGAPTVWSMLDGNGNPVTGQGVTVAIVDTGIDYRHPDLGGCFGPDCKVIGGFDFVNGDDDPMDDNGHGTYVSGIAAANGTLRGVAPGARLLAYKALDANGAGSSSDVIAALERAVDPDGDPLTEDAADVINLSLGSFDDSNSPMSIAANRAMDAGSIVVAGAGNSGSDYGTPLSPGNAESVVTVGAVDNAGQIASFSSRGPVKDKDYVKPEIVAPGVGIRSTAPDGNYATFSGTSLATPHVAGGAALLMQLHPTLSPQEVKALLVNNARDVGEDVFTQGGGMLDLAAAATAQVVAMPALPSFGQVELDQALWQAQRPLTIRNISTQAWSGTLELPSSPLPGVRIQAASGDSISLAPGQSATLDLQLEVDNQTLPFSEKPSLHHESSLALVTGGGRSRIPWTLFKAAVLEINIQGDPDLVWVFTDACSDFYVCPSVFYESGCLTLRELSKSPLRLRVRPGVYTALVTYPQDLDNNCSVSTHSFIFKEGLNVDDQLSVRVAPADAINRVTIGDILDEEGRRVDPNKLEFVSTQVDMLHPRAKTAFEFRRSRYGLSFARGVVPLELARFSNLSSDIKINVAGLALDNTAPAEHRIHYVISEAFDSGISASHQFGLDARDVGKVTFSYTDKEALTAGVFSDIGTEPTSALGFVASGLGSGDRDFHTAPFKATTYAGLAKFHKGEQYPAIKIYKRLEPDFPLLVESGPVTFLERGAYVKLRQFSRKGPVIRYRGIGHDLPIGQPHGPAFFSAFPQYFVNEKVFSILDSNNCLGCTGLQKDFRQNFFFEEMEYAVLCDGTQVETGHTRGHHQVRLTEHACREVEVRYTMPTRLFGVRDTSSVSITINTEAPPLILDRPGWLPLIQAPSLDELLVLSDGRLSRVLDGERSQVWLKVANDSTQEAPITPLDVSLEYRLGESSSWQPLDLSEQQDGLVATLPAIDGAHVGSLRVHVSDEHGNSLVQTLNSLFLIGKLARSLAGPVPAFGALPEIRVQASGPLTPFTLPAVLANDPVDGALVATTDSKGPYTLGRHSILWTAVNSADVLGSAIQTLNVVDITPPQVTPPPAVVRPATGLFTPVDLGQASAVDQVDGALSAVPNPTGPFGVGSNQVTWTATDSAGNMGSATQTVTITGDDSLPIQGVSSATEAGAQDITLAALPDLPDARFAGTPLVAPVVISATRGVDDSPSLPYDALSDGELWMSVTVPATPEEGAREYLLLAVAESATAQEPHLFVGEDLDGDGPELAEQRCANKTAAKPQVCETRIAREAGAPESTYWVLAQNIRSGLGNADSIFLRAAAVPLLPENKALVVTGPGHVTADRMFTYRVAWDDPDWLPGEERVGYVLVYATPDELAYYEPFWLKRGSATSAAHMLTPGVPRTLSLAPGQAQDRLYVDIPANTTAVTFRSSGSDEVDLYAAHVPDPAGPGIAPAPARDLAQYVSQTAGGEQAITLDGSEVLPGRWYLTPVNRGSGSARVSVGASIDSREAAPPLRPGHYFDPARSGQGVFLDFAGDQWAMVWYAYLEDGTPTWYFAQAAAPGSDQAQWSAPLYRVAWNGFTTHATVVGNISLTILPGPVDASPKLTMSFNLDGVSGSEPMTQLGDDSCPSFGGVPLDATGHWYSPERPGFGYSVQFQLHTEFHAAYVYDDLGYPRWLIGQKDLDTDEVNVPLLQVSGFCPTCQAVTPTTTGVGVLKRFLASASNNDGKPGLIHMDVDVRFAPPLSGEWRQSLPVFMLTYRNGCK